MRRLFTQISSECTGVKEWEQMADKQINARIFVCIGLLDEPVLVLQFCMPRPPPVTNFLKIALSCCSCLFVASSLI